MSFLTPLYLLGALAVSLPVVLHMIRRTPRDRREFSSTMFLQPSPPQITRRSRIEHWLLLLLRGLAVCLLALAFARPFLRLSDHTALNDHDGRSLVVLIDASASMRRDKLWIEAIAVCQQMLTDDVTPADQIAVLTFDDRQHTVCGFDQWTALDPGRRADAVLASLSEISPSWRSTDLGAALVEAAELLDTTTATEEGFRDCRVVVVSDLQSGSRLESLQAYDWPKGVAVELRPVGVDASPNNAGIHVVGDAHDFSDSANHQRRVRVVNANGADRDEFAVNWVDEFNSPAQKAERGALDGSAVSIIVPAGQSRIVRAAERPTGSKLGRLHISGDDHEFDNVSYVPPSRPRSATVAIVSDEAPDDPQGMRFYLPPALPSLPQRQINVIDWNNAGAQSSPPPQLVVVTTAPPESSLPSLRTYASEGGTVLFAAASADALTSVFALSGVPPRPVAEAEIDDYSMLTGIEFEHPLFASLGDPRYSDFTNVRFWKHRRLADTDLPNGRVVARFDDGDPAVMEVPIGQGRLIVLTAGWQPRDSQLAISSRFVPMLNGLVDDVAGISEQRTTYLVGEAVSLAEFGLSAAEVEAIRRPDGERLTIAADATTITQTDLPGVYSILLRDSATGADEPPSFAVNLDPSESRTSRMTDAALVSAGVRLTADETVQVIDDAAQRQLKSGELEQRQKLWKWLIVAVIALLVVETLLAGRITRRQLRPASTAPST